jgi:hypothetical protein
VTPPIMASVLEHGAPDPVHRIATMAFFKFKGTDQRSRPTAPTALAEALHETLNIAQAAFAAEDIALLCVDVDANGGKLFCSSGVPLTSEDDEGRMLRAARSIIDANRRFRCTSASTAATSSPVSSEPPTRRCSRSWATPSTPPLGSW